LRGDYSYFDHESVTLSETKAPANDLAKIFVASLLKNRVNS
jgi:hypothetical protein